MFGNAVFSLIVSDFLVNLAAGWFGAIFIAPNFSKAKGLVKATVLIVDFLLAIFSLWGAYELRKI